MTELKPSSRSLPQSISEQLHATWVGDQWPQILTFSCSESQANCRLRIQAELHWLAGHFPGKPVLPGIVQAHWAIELSRLCFPHTGGFRRLDNLKFKTMLLPEAEVTLALTLHSSKPSVNFTYLQNTTPCSQGRVYFAGTRTRTSTRSSVS